MNSGLPSVRAWTSLAVVNQMAMLCQPAADAYEEALAHARRAADRLQLSIHRELPFQYLFGPMPAEGAIERCGAMLDP